MRTTWRPFAWVSAALCAGTMGTALASHKPKAGQIASMVNVTGFGSGPFISGLIAQFLPYPLVTPYVTVLIPSIIILYGLRSVRQEIQGKSGRPSFMPKLEVPAEPALKPLFLIISMTAFAAFGMFSLYGSLAPSFLEEMIPWSGPAISGTATASGLFISGCTQFLLRSQPPHRALYLGMLFLLLACLALGLILLTSSPPSR